METTGNDIIYSAEYTTLIIRDYYGVHVNQRYQKDLQKFVQYYWESVKGYGRRLNDVDFRDLQADAREEIVLRAFNLWRNYHVETGKMVK